MTKEEELLLETFVEVINGWVNSDPQVGVSPIQAVEVFVRVAAMASYSVLKDSSENSRGLEIFKAQLKKLEECNAMERFPIH